MGAWYTIGLWLGLGVGVGVLLGGAVAGMRTGAVVAAVAAAAAAFAAGWALEGTTEAIAAAVGALLGGVGAAQVGSGALRRGGTRGGNAMLLGVAAVILAALAFVPAVGYVEAVVVPALALRLRRRSPERYAGLRTLAK